VAAGALFASVLFMIGKFCITFYITTSDIGSTYGSAGSLVILLLWIFYSANILYFGAEVSKAYALKYGAEIKPRDYAVTIRVVEVESNKSTVQQNEEDQDTNKSENLNENEEEIKKMENHTEMAK
jgi:membrane protein